MFRSCCYSSSLILALIAGAQLHAYLACAYAGMFTQHRLTISIISYFVIGFIGQMLSLVGTIVFAIIVYPSLDNIGSMVELQNGILLSVCVIFLLTLLVDALLWALTQWLMRQPPQSGLIFPFSVSINKEKSLFFHAILYVVSCIF